MSSESVRVAVRVRPFNSREIDRKSKCIIAMNGNQTSIKNPDGGEPKKFSFDFSYWSHNDYYEKDGILIPNAGSNYASQDNVYNDLGGNVLDNAFKGYNCSLFAYGQTGSGKSYSMVGYGKNRGIVPITCDRLFDKIKTDKDGGSDTRFEVTFSMLEIYNEQVRDLLCKSSPKGGLAIRQNVKLGLFYVQNLKKVPVGSYVDINGRIEEGTKNRTVASTQMNATSSRAHTVVTIIFDQIIKTGNGETKKSSTINLVDLAGSERADSTGATGDRLKEGANINKSLSALGNVISALADLSMGKKKIMVPYRDSALTKLLQNALGGNSKTIMIAALSPADINYDETLSTLRYANRAKSIKNKAVVNENPMEKIIRELKEENDRLKAMMSGKGIVDQTKGMSQMDIDALKKQLEEEIRSQMEEIQTAESGDFDKKLILVQSQNQESSRIGDVFLSNLNEDPLLSNVILHELHESGTTKIGRKDTTNTPNIVLSGLSIMVNHAIIEKCNDKYEIKPDTSNASIKINGHPLIGPNFLEDKDRILFGSNHLFVFNNKKNPTTDPALPKEISYEFAQKEIAQAKGFDTGAGLSREQQIMQEQILEILPMVSEVNAISEEMNKHRTFEVVLISAAAQEGKYGEEKVTKVMIKMKNLKNENTWLWERGKFMNRRYLIQEMYQQYVDSEIFYIEKEKDPFWEPTEDVVIGTANMFLQSLVHNLDMYDELTITDYKAQEEGILKVHLIPCTASGKELDDNAFVSEPEELLGRTVHFKVKILSGRIKKARFSRGVCAKFRVYKEEELTSTPMLAVENLCPEFNFSCIKTFNPVTEDHIKYLKNSCITFSVYGKQEDVMIDSNLSKMNTKELRMRDKITPERRISSMEPDAVAQLKTDLSILNKKYEKIVKRENAIRDLTKSYEKKVTDNKDCSKLIDEIKKIIGTGGSLKFKTTATIISSANGKSQGDSKACIIQ
ncbi:hypothetical protein A3Q56_02996 [Intoshia linei]|uniref:Kinesin-like protein n=1 Tax=Intoshia linei TaxID=1819745 RepID=A0A177B4Q7_9BILA|nr:hypothetical protein A3Q56_02996 [Intoshia linei]